MKSENKKMNNKNPNSFLLANKKSNVTKDNNLKVNPSLLNDDDFWKDCLDKNNDDLTLESNLNKDVRSTNNSHINISENKPRDSKINMETKTKHQEYYLTFNDDKINNEISIESKRTEVNYLDPSNFNFSQSSNLKIDTSSIKTPVEDNKKITVNPSENEGKFLNHNNITKTTNEINTQASRNINKILYENTVNNTKMTREEKFQCFLTKYSQGSVTESDDLKTKANQRSIKAQERCFLLYEKSKIKNEVTSMIYKKNNELKLMKELSECTFKPRTNSSEYLRVAKEITNNQYIKNSDEAKNFYERSLMWKKLKNENLDRSKSIRIRNDAPSFKPKINITNTEIFNTKKNLLNDYVTRNYLNRLQKARKENHVRKSIIDKGGKPISNRLYKPYNGRANSQENLYSFHEDSQSNIGSMIRSLHRSLHAIDLNEDY